VTLWCNGMLVRGELGVILDRNRCKGVERKDGMSKSYSLFEMCFKGKLVSSN
jgi:hypothetical protein